MNIYNQILRKVNNYQIEKQKPLVEVMYNLIKKRENPELIYNKYNKYVSHEIKSILLKLVEVGYLTYDNIQKKGLRASVIIPHFNQHKYLDEALLALCEQSQLPDEVIVVDDSSDNIEKVDKIVNQYSDRISIKLLKPKEKFYAGYAR